MTERQPTPQRTQLVYTPLSHIPLGEPVTTENGSQALKIKHGGKSEVITLDSIYALVVEANAKKK